MILANSATVSRQSQHLGIIHSSKSQIGSIRIFRTTIDNLLRVWKRSDQKTLQTSPLTGPYGGPGFRSRILIHPNLVLQERLDYLVLPSCQRAHAQMALKGYLTQKPLGSRTSCKSALLLTLKLQNFSAHCSSYAQIEQEIFTQTGFHMLMNIKDMRSG